MRPKFLTTFLVMGGLCLYFITNLHADTSTQIRQLIQLKSDATAVSSSNDFLSFDLEDKQIQIYIKRYTQNGRRATESMLGRAAFYFPIFEYYLKQQNLPEALKFLPVVESNLQEEVVSPTGAAGLWQFMPVTARYYGLQVDESIDERRNPFKASAAAATMLAELHEQFDDWFLALAAYNCGPNRVKKAIRKAGTKDFQQVKRYLPKQTRNYANKLMAAIYIGQNYPSFGLEAKRNAEVLETIELNGAYSVPELAIAANLSLKQFQILNPNLPKYFLSSTQETRLTIPKYAVKLLEEYTRANPPSIIEITASREAEKYDITNICFWPEEDPTSNTQDSTPIDADKTLNTWALIRRNSTLWT